MPRLASITGSQQRRTVMRDTAGQDRPVDGSARRRRWLLPAVAGALVVAGAIALVPVMQRLASAEASVSRERIRTAQVVVGPFVRDVSVQGTVVAAVSPTLFAPAQGVVTFEVQAGDSVRQGQLLARIASPGLENELQQEQATLQSLETNLERSRIEARNRMLESQQRIDLAGVAIVAAERELRRAEASWQERIISERDYEKARDDVDTARLEHEHSRERAALERESLEFELRTLELERDRQRLRVENLRRRFDELSILSPVDGMVGTLITEQKAAVAEHAPLLSVVDLTALEVEIRVPETYADDLALGMDAEVTYAGRLYPAQVTAVSPEVQQNEVRGRVRFADSPPAGLRQNQRLPTRIVLESRPQALKVQRGPFLDSGAGRIAYVLDGDVARRRSVRIGATSVSEIEILEGLEAGDTIIISSTSGFDGAETVLLH